MTRRPLLCPSANADGPEAAVIGVVLGSADEPRVRPLERPVPVTDEILHSLGYDAAEITALREEGAFGKAVKREPARAFANP